jgi:hypothetical protein
MSPSLAKRRSYRRRTMRSICRKKTGKKCLRVNGCKPTRKTMKRKSYCRKSKKHIVTGGGRLENKQVTDYLEQIKDTTKFPLNTRLVYNKIGCGGKCVITVTSITNGTSDDNTINEQVKVFHCQFNINNGTLPVDIVLLYNRYIPGQYGDQHSPDTPATKLSSEYQTGNYNTKNFSNITLSMTTTGQAIQFISKLMPKSNTNTNGV